MPLTYCTQEKKREIKGTKLTMKIQATSYFNLLEIGEPSVDSSSLLRAPASLID